MAGDLTARFFLVFLDGINGDLCRFSLREAEHARADTAESHASQIIAHGHIQHRVIAALK